MQVDLNLLVALDALIEHQSVQDAARALYLTPPAMSHALRRLREATGDDLLVRNGREMLPTARALALREEVRDLVTRSKAALAPSPTLDLASLRRVFTVRGNEALIAALAPELLAETMFEAPGVSFTFLAEQAVDGHELTRGLVDIEIGSSQPHPPTIRSILVGSDVLSVVMRIDHPLASRDHLTVDAFAAAPHVVVSRRGRFRGPIDDVLESRGVQRTVIASLPSTAIALQVVDRSDAITVLASQLIPHGASVATLPLPFELPPLSATVNWHSRHDSDLAHLWLRTKVERLLAVILGSSPDHSAANTPVS